METTSLIERIRDRKDCRLYPPAGLPEVTYPLPPDLEKFYLLAGGAALFEDATYPIEIVSPTQFVRANPVIVGEDCPDDISFDWHIVAKAAEQHITIDLADNRLGRCYDSFWDRHGVPGECQVIARDFTSLLRLLLDAEGKFWFCCPRILPTWATRTTSSAPIQSV